MAGLLLGRDSRRVLTRTLGETHFKLGHHRLISCTFIDLHLGYSESDLQGLEPRCTSKSIKVHEIDL
jgi:hypothetical protein